jgi:hypothetical protein
MSGILILTRGLFSCSHVIITGEPIMAAKYIHFLLRKYSVYQRLLYGLLLTPFEGFGSDVALSMKPHYRKLCSKWKQKLNTKKYLKGNPYF